MYLKPISAEEMFAIIYQTWADTWIYMQNKWSGRKHTKLEILGIRGKWDFVGRGPEWWVTFTISSVYSLILVFYDENVLTNELFVEL